MTLHIPPRPCPSCPYRKDHPSGVWSEDEYEKLRPYDGLAVGAFLCHQTNATGRETVCKGWSTVHADSIAVRIGMANGLLDPDEVYTETDVDLWESGNAAADHGQANIDLPTVEARIMAAKLMDRGAGK